jgi:hypothetical protein
MQALTAEQAQQLAARQPGSRVLTWADAGGQTSMPGGALSASALAAVIEALKAAVVREVAARPGVNELMLRWRLSRQEVGEVGAAGLPSPYTWAMFAQQYPTFWGKLTSASTTRADVIIIHSMLDARRRFEAGELASEEEVSDAIYSDMIAMNLRKEERGGGGAAGNGNGAAAAGGPAISREQERALMQRARLRRELLHRTYASTIVPTEELERRGVVFRAATSVLHEICAEEEARKAGENGGKGGRKAKAAAAGPQLTAQDVTFGRMLLQVRVALAKRFGKLPEPLDPKGANFAPTYVRSAQLDLRWTGEQQAIATSPDTA